MFLHTLTVLLSLAGAVTPYPSPANVEREATTTGLKLYGYGSGISGLEVYYSDDDGKAYLSTEGTANLTQLTWPEPSMDAPWNVDVVTTAASSTASFYIVTSDASFDAAGFMPLNTSAPTGAAIKGFFKYGTQIMWSNGGTYESKFWAQKTAKEGQYKLAWNSANVDKEDSVPVTIKTVAP